MWWPLRAPCLGNPGKTLVAWAPGLSPISSPCPTLAIFQMFLEYCDNYTVISFCMASSGSYKYFLANVDFLRLHTIEHWTYSPEQTCPAQPMS